MGFPRKNWLSNTESWTSNQSKKSSIKESGTNLDWPYSVNPHCKFREFKPETGSEAYLQYVEEHLLHCFFFQDFRLGTLGLFEELGRHTRGWVTGGVS